ncbi:galactose operon repressor [Photobacterium aphoticum]|uniref:Galactose operon repressor n=1 Tax=Photobacterium aphoticum TaxID=754436 RepID=A0A090QNP2_9GAMM|nr:galactose operon repressor [Photobacterium aphoticum]
MPTLKEIAEITGYSMATVSRVINRQGHVSEKTKLHIEKTAKEIGFTRENNNRLKINSGTPSIGVVINRISSPFYSLLAQSVEEVGREHNRHLMLCSSGYDANEEQKAIDFLLSHGCRHIVLHSKALSDSALEGICRQHSDVVLIGRHVEAVQERCVWLDSQAGTYQATQHLINLGHRRIGFINLAFDCDDKHNRLAGYLNAMKDNGLMVDPDWVQNADWVEVGGRNAARKLLSQGLPVTALLAFNDVYAASALREFQSRGVQIPAQLSIIGFDDVMPQCYFSPALTTLKYPIAVMARKAALLSLTGNYAQFPQGQCYYPTLIHRESVAPYQHEHCV